MVECPACLQDVPTLVEAPCPTGSDHTHPVCPECRLALNDLASSLVDAILADLLGLAIAVAVLEPDGTVRAATSADLADLAEALEPAPPAQNWELN